METLGQRLDARRGVAPGFDFLRLFLATSVVAWHSLDLGAGLKLDDEQFVWVFGWSILGAFFALSGFLISASALRLSLPNFLINRGLRIFPALAVEIVLSALILGPLFTTLHLGEYFKNTQTWHYFTNIVGLVNYRLPGVFENNLEQTVNTSIWTVPHELACYALISALVILKWLNKPKIILTAIALFLLLGFIGILTGVTDTSEGIVSKIAYRSVVGPPARLYGFFLMGILFYILRNKIQYSPILFFMSIIVIVECGVFHYDHRTSSPLALLMLAGPVTYVTMFLGVTDIWLPGFLKKGDYSYGIYLYGWPIQQITYTLYPTLKSAWLEFVLSMPLILLFSVMSWHVIERPILMLRKKFSFVARVRLEDSPTAPARTSSETRSNNGLSERAGMRT